MVREVANNVDEKNNYEATLAPREDDSGTDPLQPQGTSWTYDVDSNSTIVAHKNTLASSLSS